MNNKTSQQNIAKYYSRFESRVGYLVVMNRSQHFGYYDKNHTNEQDAQIKYHEEFSKLLHLKPSMKLLDAGCGQGVVACYLAKLYNVKVTGITITPIEVRNAKKLAKKQGVTSKTSFMFADYADPPFQPESFDRIYTTETLSHAPDVEVVLKKFMELLKPGGLLVCAEYEMDYENFDSYVKNQAEFMRKYAGIYGIDKFGKGQFRKDLQKTGFKSVTEIDWTTNLKPSFDRLRRLARKTSKVVEGLRLNKYFVNVVAAKLYADGVEKGVFAYKVYTARKPV